MLSNIFYPIVCTNKFKETAAFYEDFFGFVPVYEIDQYVILERKGQTGTYLAIVDLAYDTLPEKYKRSVSGMILSLRVDNVEDAYQELYWEGLDIVTKPEMSVCGCLHFLVEDPNGILIDVVEEVDFVLSSPNDNDTKMCVAV